MCVHGILLTNKNKCFFALLHTSGKGIFAKQVSSSMRLNQCEGGDVKLFIIFVAL
jgi:hypothetical protein